MGRIISIRIDFDGVISVILRDKKRLFQLLNAVCTSINRLEVQCRVIIIIIEVNKLRCGLRAIGIIDWI